MSSSDSDEAPEEVTFLESKVSIQRKEKLQRQAEAEMQRVSKQKRRERDQRLKTQQSGRKERKLLSDLLKEEEESEEEEEERVVIDTKPKAQRLSLEKEGVQVKVRPSKVVKQLPPAGKSAVSKRDRFLFREQVPRR